jgi:hypothetical protein
LSEQQEQQEQDQEQQGEAQSDEQAKAQDAEREAEEAKEEMKAIEEDPPEKLEDWPDGAAKYETFGGPEGDHSYEEGPESKLGPSGVRHHEDGKVTVDGDEVDDPDQFKGEPVPGGPTDPEAPENREENDE